MSQSVLLLKQSFQRRPEGELSKGAAGSCAGYRAMQGEALLPRPGLLLPPGAVSMGGGESYKGG